MQTITKTLRTVAAMAGVATLAAASSWGFAFSTFGRPGMLHSMPANHLLAKRHLPLRLISILAKGL